MFGQWFYQHELISKLHDEYQTAKPYEHVIIPDFFTEEVATLIDSEFPLPHSHRSLTIDWKHYDNPIEQKYALNDFSGLPHIDHIFQCIQDYPFVNVVSRITGINDLQSDEHLHGAGLHAYPTNGKLDIHLDYSIHPITHKERRCNLIVFLNRRWDTATGNLQLWDKSLTTHVEIKPIWNTAVLFRTSDKSYHGIPRPIKCPLGTYRKSLAVYYVSQPRESAPSRPKAEFFPHPNQPVSDKLQNLYDIRKQRVLTSDDLADWRTWREEGDGYW